ncbi:MAG: beta-galactosidase [Candidatus Omnitrophica bacterium]|nr:beta-galactosidase [Candidatus Omnitrophota bacterium]
MTRKALCIIFVFLILIGCQAQRERVRENRMTDPGSRRENPFGVLEFLHWNHPWNNHKYATRKDLEKAAALMREAGVGTVRMDFLWQDIEPQQGKFDFAKYDFIVELLRNNNITVLGILDYSVDWDSPQRKWNYPSKDHRRFIDYARKVVVRYRDKVKYWEVWNEPDSHTYWEPQDGLAGYCALLKDAYIALKEIDPECRILNGGLAGGLSSVNNLYDHGAKGYFDILNLHIFDSPLHPGALSRVKAYPKLAYKVMQRNGDGAKKIWITEIGCPGVPKGVKTNNWWMGNNPGEEEQAVWAKDVFSGLLKIERVEKIFWAFFRDTLEHWKDGTDYFGLVRWDFTKKGSYAAFKRCFESWKQSSGLE